MHRTNGSFAGLGRLRLLSVSGLPSASVLALQMSRLPTDHLARPRSCRPEALDPRRRAHRRRLRGRSTDPDHPGARGRQAPQHRGHQQRPETRRHRLVPRLRHHRRGPPALAVPALPPRISAGEWITVATDQTGRPASPRDYRQGRGKRRAQLHGNGSGEPGLAADGAGDDRGRIVRLTRPAHGVPAQPGGQTGTPPSRSAGPGMTCGTGRG